MKTFINSQNQASFNDQVIRMLYMYWHELSNDDFFDLLPDEEQEIQDLVSLLPHNLVITQITMMELPTKEFAYTYIFQVPYNTNFPTKDLENAQVKLNAFFNMIKDLTDNEGYYHIVPIKGTNTIIGTFTIG